MVTVITLPVSIWPPQHLPFYQHFYHLLSLTMAANKLTTISWQITLYLLTRRKLECKVKVYLSYCIKKHKIHHTCIISINCIFVLIQLTERASTITVFALDMLDLNIKLLQRQTQPHQSLVFCSSFREKLADCDR